MSLTTDRPVAPPAPRHAPPAAMRPRVAKPAPITLAKESTDIAPLPSVEETAVKEASLPEWLAASEPVRATWRNPWWFAWKVYGKCNLDKYEWIPIPHHWGSMQKRNTDNKQAIWALGPTVAGVYAVISVTGGVGKTTQTTWHAAEMELCSDAHSLVIDSDSGAIGKAAIRYGVDMRGQEYHITHVFDLILNGHWEPTHDMLYRHLPRHEESGVRLLSTYSEIDFTEAQTRKGIRKLRPAYSVIFVDTTPGTKEPISRGARSEATVVSIPLLYGSQELEHDIFTTRQHMNKYGNDFDRRLEEGSLFILVSDVPKRDFNRRTQAKLAQRLNVPFNQVILFPRDKHLASKGTVAREQVSDLYKYALRESTRLQAEAAARHNERQPLPVPEAVVKETPERQIERRANELTLLCGSPQKAAGAVLEVAKKKL